MSRFYNRLGYEILVQNINHKKPWWAVKNVPRQTSETSETEIIKYTSIVRLYAFIYIVINAFDVNIIHSHLKAIKTGYQSNNHWKTKDKPSFTS